MEAIQELDLVIKFAGNPLEDIPLDPSYFLLNPIFVENMYEKRSLPVAYRGARSTLDLNINLAESDSEIPVDVIELVTTLTGSTGDAVLTPNFSTD